MDLQCDIFDFVHFLEINDVRGIVLAVRRFNSNGDAMSEELWYTAIQQYKMLDA